MVSYQGKDWTGKQELPYKACATENEIIHHKHLLYNADNCPGPVVVVVEGLFDCWRLGDHCGCTFGIGFTMAQVMFLAERFSRVFVLYDPEPKAQRKARQLVRALGGLGVDAKRISLEGYGDPGEMSNQDAERLMEELK